MYFSVGAHPAFRVPVTETALFEDYFLLFGQQENAGIYPIADNGLIEKTAVPFLKNTNSYPLSKELFYKDALIFKELDSTSIGILTHLNAHGLKLHFMISIHGNLECERCRFCLHRTLVRTWRRHGLHRRTVGERRHHPSRRKRHLCA